ncbi:hypothetical protein AAFF_G00414610 [Aldrovandia affinis]|uniref:Uncharacterized protein n=1 Tax=Aldrovandia affinis TaxID=143900 RepID=A0AAD7SB41_9TELE|nr:hypothetical protein AAFF_G00414610 [Aldrovandia affinis]
MIQTKAGPAAGLKNLQHRGMLCAYEEAHCGCIQDVGPSERRGRAPVARLRDPKRIRSIFETARLESETRLSVLPLAFRFQAGRVN